MSHDWGNMQRRRKPGGLGNGATKLRYLVERNVARTSRPLLAVEAQRQG